MERTTSPVAKRARKEAPDSSRPPSNTERSPAVVSAENAPHGREDSSLGADPSSSPPSMTARPPGAGEEGEEDPLFEEPVAPYEWVPDLLRVDPPTVSESPLSASMLEHAIQDPGSFRSFIELKARELAGPACTHTTGLIKWNRDKSATTCGKLQAHLLANVDLQVVQERQVKLDGDPGYCLARRVRNQVYYDASTALGAVGAGNQCQAGPCMLAAINLFAGKGQTGIPKEVVSAMCPN